MKFNYIGCFCSCCFFKKGDKKVGIKGFVSEFIYVCSSFFCDGIWVICFLFFFKDFFLIDGYI